MTDRRLGRGVTRTAYRVGRWAVKVPNRGWLVRGYLANQSEWRHRDRADVNAPVFHLLGLVAVYPLAETMDRGHSDHFEATVTPVLVHLGYSQEEAKPSSWGRVGDRWLVIDFDEAWSVPRRGLIGRAYYWNQDRLGRKWSAM